MQRTKGDEATAPARNTRKRTGKRFPVVGIGASAGGLEAFTQFLSQLPPDTGMSFVLIQHLDRSHESQLCELLSRATAMPVHETRNGIQVQPDEVYIIPPNTSLTIESGLLRLVPRSRSGPHLPVDRFLQSLAEERGSLAIAIILSGSGSDGAEGLRAIKAQNGIAFVQDESSAKYTGMPKSAIATGCADFILPPHEIAAKLASIGHHPYLTPQDHVDEEDLGRINRLFTLLEQATKVDFRHYKQTTIRRRIGRRMLVHGLQRLADYIAYAEEHPEEVLDLYKDILINVTSFFREPETFEALCRFLSESIADRSRDDAFRIWVPGCSSGEEVYSLAICLTEVLESAGLRVPIQIFGTDISDRALDRARKAAYPPNVVGEISSDRLRRFFVEVEGGYQISKSIRECCIFAKHDLAKDPPFSRMDLVSCRNVLIYLDSVLQRRILPVLHYSLKPTGFLMLGSAETPGGFADLFTVVDPQRKIYGKKTSPSSRLSMEYPLFPNLPEPPLPVPAPARPPALDLERKADAVIQDLYGPDAVVIDKAGQVLFFRGRPGFYLNLAVGEASLNLFRLAKPSLALPLRKTVSAAIERNVLTETPRVRVENDGETRDVKLRVVPLTGRAPEEASYVVLFERLNHAATQAPAVSNPPEHPGSAPSSAEERIAQLERELSETRDYLRTTTEQSEATTEELKASNEEACSTNEELQSTNEELRTTKEEVESSNEELHTVNEELQNKNQELDATNDDLTNILDAASIPIVILTNDLRLRRYTPGAEKLFHIIPADIGRPIGNLRGEVEIPALEPALLRVIETLDTKEGEIQARNGRWYAFAIRPFRTGDNRIEGAVLTLADIDALKRSLAVAQEARDYAEGILDTIREPLLVLDHDLRVQTATASFYSTFRASREETEGQLIYDLGNGQWNIPKLRQVLMEILPKNSRIQDFEVEHTFPHIGHRVMRLNARRISRPDRASQTILLAIEDVTERREISEVRYRRLFETAKDGLLVLDGDTGEITGANPCLAEMLRYSPKELIGKKLWEADPFTSLPENILEESRRKDTVREDLQLATRSGTRIVTEVIGNRYMVGENPVVQLNFRDITERKRIEQDLKRSNQDLQQFAFAASHDLQEPLRTIRSYTELLAKRHKDNLDPDDRQFVNFITKAVDRMSQLILDLLSYSQVTSRAAKVEQVDSETVLAWVLMNLQMAIQETKAVITHDQLPNVHIDQMHFIQLLQNLIGNALKYRGTEPPRVHLSARNAGQEWVFAVTDNGIGIDPKQTERIFGVFKRLHGVDVPGTGIGLAICRKIVERHGGRIWVESAPGQGSTFFFTVPDKPGANGNP